jgi:predicted nucleic acid-binding protein
MAGTVLVDSGFLVALLNRRDRNHRWAVAQSSHLPPPWKTCEAVLSETFYLLGKDGRRWLATILRRSAVISAFTLADNRDPVLDLIHKYADLPMSLADACLVRMTEVLPDPVILTTDQDFRIYRRHSRQIVPCSMPS